MIILAPGRGVPLFALSHHAPWLTRPVIDITEACVIGTLGLILLLWLKPDGVRTVLAIGIALVVAVVICKSIAHLVYVPRPFVAHHFRPLYPHATDSSFPSTTVAYFAAAAAPALFAARRIGWVLVVITIEVAIGCVYVGVHYGTDVVAGAAIGGGCGVAAWLALGRHPLAPMVTWLDDALAKSHLRRAAPVPTSPGP